MTRPLVCVVAIDQDLSGQVRADLHSGSWLVKELTLEGDEGCETVSGDLTLLVSPALDAEALTWIIRLSKPSLPPVLVVAPVENPLEVADALKSGATDVAPYPVERAELTARVASLLRRQQWNDADLSNPLLVLDSKHHSLAVGERAMAFPPREWAILKTLIDHSGTPVAIVRLAKTDEGVRLSRSAVVASVSRLRNRLRQFGVPGIDVHAIPGRGYQLNITLPIQTFGQDLSTGMTASPPIAPDESHSADQV